MDKEKENAILDAVDVVCLNCVEDTLNDNSVWRIVQYGNCAIHYLVTNQRQLGE